MHFLPVRGSSHAIVWLPSDIFLKLNCNLCFCLLDGLLVALLVDVDGDDDRAEVGQFVGHQPADAGASTSD